MDTQMKYTIIGGGLAGASAVEGIREHDHAGTIALFGKENRLPYDRPPLSKGLWLGKAKLEDLPVHDEAFYTSQGVQLHLDSEIVEISPSTHRVRDERGAWHTYEKLLLSTGGSPRRLPFGDGVVHYYRTVDDYLWLKQEAGQANDFVLIGGGFIGAELGAALTMQGKRVTMLFPAHTLLSNVLPADLASFVTEYYRSRGVTVMGDESVVNAERSQDRVVISTGSRKKLSAEAAIAAIGLELNTDIAARAGLAVKNGIAVNEFLQSSDHDVYAAGDIAYFPAASLDEHLRIEHWNNALAQGKHAGGNMAGANKPFDYLPYFYSDLFDLGFEAVGRLDARMVTVADWKENYREGVVYYLDGGRVKGVLLWNVWEKVDAAREVINRKKTYANTDDLKGAL